MSLQAGNNMYMHGYTYAGAFPKFFCNVVRVENVFELIYRYSLKVPIICGRCTVTLAHSVFLCCSNQWTKFISCVDHVY